MSNKGDSFSVSSHGFRLSAQIVPWDMDAFGFPVAQVRELEVIDRNEAMSHYCGFQAWLEAMRVQIVSCRLPHDRLRESMFLETNGFRFIEMVLHPSLKGLQEQQIPLNALHVAPALDSDIPVLQAMAEHAFRHERYHVDPRLDPQLADRRYGQWVKNSLSHPIQRLLKIMDGGRVIGLFVVESRYDNSNYWHLTAIAPECQGCGYGARAWQAMLRYHQAEGASSVTTTISARNIPVLNLYAKLNFRFLPPEMTFHWVRGNA